VPFEQFGHLSFPDKTEIKRKAFFLSGSSRGDEVTLRVHGEDLWEVETKGSFEGLFIFDWTAHRVSILWMAAPEGPGEGWGRKKFQSLARRWKDEGFLSVLASPADGPRAGLTGFYFWPRIGFKGFIDPDVWSALPDEFKVPSGKIEDLFALEGGREYWRKKGSPLWGLTYDLRV